MESKLNSEDTLSCEMGDCCSSKEDVDPLQYHELDQKQQAPRSPKEKKKPDLNQFSLCILTWNVSGKAPVNDPKLDSLLRLEDIASYQPDMFVIALQELIDLTAKRVFKMNNKRMSKWELKIESVLNHKENKINENSKNNNVNNAVRTSIFKHRYVKLVTTRMFGMLLMVFVSNKKKEFFSANDNGICDVVTSKIGTGIGNKFGNKGAVTIQFRLFNFHLCFVNCHLAAHQENVKRRREDAVKIMNQTRFNTDNKGMSVDFTFDSYDFKSEGSIDIKNNNNNNNNEESKSSSVTGSMRHKSENIVNLADASNVNILDNDLIFVFGDLNYRLDFEMSDKNDKNKNKNGELTKVLNLINDGKYKELLKKDQLINEMKNENVFSGFSESKINFAPTFKYCENTYEQINTKRMPSYCDRILWRVDLKDKNKNENKNKNKNSKRRLKIQCNKYTSHMASTMSDHKPVVGLFQCYY